MILLKVDDKTFGKSKITYDVVDKENGQVIISGKCMDFTIVSDKYYELKEQYGSSNVKLVLK
ncbi:hypothetical protein ACN6MY_11465 [Peribacillus sp. B-H-3]|jgi:hypothetical protein|uniref:hypothetical protein n=1 Tax=Peribacillus sp. B-H-3 TaxID=3400420 RepID=UPI003B023911